VDWDLTYVEAGSFTMGSPNEEATRDPDEGPQHEVTIPDGFFLGTFEVTKDQWIAVMGTSPWLGEGYVNSDGDSPAQYISYNAAVQLITALNNDMTTQGLPYTFRLPSEAEWEYSARAGSTDPFPSGTSDANLGDHSWYKPNSFGIGLTYPRTVGTKLVNPWGFYDLHGNVYEWCEDIYQTDYTGAPTNGSAWLDAGTERVIRGGSVSTDALHVRTAARHKYTVTGETNSVGVRLAAEGPAPEVSDTPGTPILNLTQGTPDHTFTLDWSNSTDNTTHRLEGRPSGGTFSGIYDGPGADMTLVRPVGTYEFRVLTREDGLSSSWSAIRTVTVTDDPLVTVTVDGVNFTFSTIPNGTFQMGSDADEVGRDADEGPVHSVTVSEPPLFGIHEVTKEQWLAVLGTSPWSGEGYISTDPDTPAQYVDFYSAVDLVDAINTDLIEQGVPYRVRLPTEAEWEYAARAGTETKFFFGNDTGAIGNYMWYGPNAFDIDEKYTHEVMTKLPNPWGLYDTLGNIYEWCEDIYQTDYTGAPNDGTAWLDTGTERIIRGGSVSTASDEVTSAARHKYGMGLQTNSVGVRLVIEPLGPPPRITFDLNGVEWNFTQIPSGEFTMGSPPNEMDRDTDEGPTHVVSLGNETAMGTFEVTKEQWFSIMGTEPWDEEANPDLGSPMINGSYVEVHDFINRMNLALFDAGMTFSVRLPSEAEWEYSARAGTTGPFPFQYMADGVIGSILDTETSSIPSIGISGLATHDLDGDGDLDLVVSNYNDGSTNSLNSYVYYQTPSGYSTGSRLSLPTEGGYGISIDDLDADGYPDIVFSNHQIGADRSTDSYIYWGSALGYSPGDRTSLPTEGTLGNTIADVDGDGLLDIVFANYIKSGDVSTFSYIYWGTTQGFSTLHRTSLPTVGAFRVSVDDLDSDGYNDIIFSGFMGTEGLSTESQIYWGSPGNFSLVNRTYLPVVASGGNIVQDLNEDGYKDIVFSSYSSNNDPSIIYWGSASGFSTENTLELPTRRSLGVEAGDLNEDGFIDLVFNNYNMDPDGNYYAYIYWGYEEGYSPAMVTKLPQDQNLVSLIDDLDADGHLDLIVGNHKQGESYTLDSVIYWGFPQTLEEIGDQGLLVNQSGLIADHSGPGPDTEGVVGSYPANQWGLFDMVGNVWEWVEDDHHDSFDGAPVDGSVWTGGGSYRVIRGGGFQDTAEHARSASRNRLLPTQMARDVGFRLVLETTTIVRTSPRFNWEFDEGVGTVTVEDGNDLSASTLTGTGWTNGVQGEALTFDGVDDRVSLGPLNLNLRTISIWFRMDPLPDYDDIRTLVVRDHSNEEREFGMYIYGTGNPGHFYFQRTDSYWQTNSGHLHSIYSDNDGYDDGQWHMAVGVIDPTEGMKLYMDGVLQSDTEPSTVPMHATDLNVILGRWGEYDIRYYPGDLDKLRVWEEALGPDEIGVMYAIERALVPLTVPLPPIPDAPVLQATGTPDGEGAYPSDTGSMVFSWEAVDDTDYYLLYQDGALILNSTGLGHTVVGLGDGTYTFTLKAGNENGTSDPSGAVNVAVLIPPPVIPEAPVLQATGTPDGEGAYPSDTGSMVFSWAPVDDAEFYLLFRDGALVRNTTGTGTTISGMVDGNYSFNLQAGNVNGTSDDSATVNVTVLIPLPPVPDAPVLSTPITPEQDGSHISETGNLSFTWVTVDHAEWYLFYQDGFLLLNTTNTWVMLYNLPEANYLFTLFAGNDNGTSEATSALRVTVAIPVPIIPVAPVIDVMDIDLVGESYLDTDGNFTIDWEAVPKATTYTVYLNGSLAASTSDTSMDFTDMGTGFHNFTVTAGNDNGTSPVSNVVQVRVDIPVVIPVPSIPTLNILYDVAVGGIYQNDQGLVVFTWDMDLLATNYTLYWDGGMVTTDDTMIQVDDLPEGLYTFTLAASNAQGYSDNSTPVVVDIDLPPPLDPPAITMADIIDHDGTYTISWSLAPSASVYHVYREGVLVLSTPLLELTFSDVPNGTYTYTIVAENSFGLSDPSDQINVTVSILAPQIPESPMLIVALPKDNLGIFTSAVDDIQFSWAPVALAEEYTLFEDGVELLTTAGTDVVIGPLENGLYAYHLVATNGNGSSAASMPIGVRVAVPIIPEPPVFQGDNMTDTDGAYQLQWDVVPYARDYAVYENGFGVAITASTGFSFADKPNGTYTYTIVAMNANGSSPHSALLKVTVAIVPPDLTPPTIIVSSGKLVFESLPLVLTGSASDTSGLARISYSLADGPWIEVTPSTTWTIRIDALEEGDYSILIRVEDTLGNMDQRSMQFTYELPDSGIGEVDCLQDPEHPDCEEPVDNTDDSTSVTVPGFGSGQSVLGVAAAAVVVAFFRRDRSRSHNATDAAPPTLHETE